MLRILCQRISIHWMLVLACWLALASCMAMWPGRPTIDEVAEDGELRFLPQNVPSRQAEQLFHSAFSRDILNSSIVVVIRRPGRPEGLVTASENPLQNDFDFIEQVLRPRLEAALQAAAADSSAGLPPLSGNQPPADGLAAASPVAEAGGKEPDAGSPAAAPSTRHLDRHVPAWKIRTFADDTIGHLLISEDRQATLLIVELTTEFLDRHNWPLVRAVEQLVQPFSPLRRHPDPKFRIPPGLDLTLSGTATVGRDYGRSIRSAARFVTWAAPVVTTLVLIIATRTPLVVLVILATGLLTARISLALFSLMAAAGWLTLFAGVEIYMTIALYGACTASGLAFLSRYREALEAGTTLDDAVALAIARSARVTCTMAATSLASAAMLLLTEFEKFAQAGVGLMVALCVATAASLTLLPALVRLCGPLLLWPHITRERIRDSAGWISPRNLLGQLALRRWLEYQRRRTIQLLVEFPARTGMAALLALALLACLSTLVRGPLRYGFLSELSEGHPSIDGTRAAQEHFAAGSTSPITLLLENPEVDFTAPRGITAVGRLSRELFNRRESLGIADLRSVAAPFGLTSRALESEQRRADELARMTLTRQIVERRIREKKITDIYVSDQPRLRDHVTRIDIVLQSDPFSRQSLQRFGELRTVLGDLLSDSPLAGSGMEFFGATASLNDLQTVTDRDRQQLVLLLPVAVLLVTIVLLRQLPVAVLLVCSLLLCCQTAAGLTAILFQLGSAGDAGGLEWKMPVYLFVLLLAAGTDFTLLLLDQIPREQDAHGPVQGVTQALLRTGPAISVCGFLTAALGGMLLLSSLSGLRQLGLGLMIGSLLAAFVVRRLMIPAWLVLRYSGQLGHLAQSTSRTTLPGSGMISRPSDSGEAPAPATGPLRTSVPGSVPPENSDQTDRPG